jgi:Flp pilus assembly protein TadD
VFFFNLELFMFSINHLFSVPRTLLVAALFIATPATFAADTSGSNSSTQTAAPDVLVTARQQISAKLWPQALAELKRVNDTSSADWNNLMGYSLRKSSPPDLDGSEKFYNEALRIDPKHKGALEYSGELYLMKGDLPTAEKRLAALSKACTFGCDEYTDLKKAVERYKANGNKVVSSTY